jgi:hypothetical protein
MSRPMHQRGEPARCRRFFVRTTRHLSTWFSFPVLRWCLSLVLSSKEESELRYRSPLFFRRDGPSRASCAVCVAWPKPREHALPGLPTTRLNQPSGTRRASPAPSLRPVTPSACSFAVVAPPARPALRARALRAKPLRPLECNPAGDGLRGAVARAKRRSCKTRAVASQPSSAALPPSESRPPCSDRRGPRCARQATGLASTAAQTTAFAHALRRGGGSACPLAFAALTSRPAAPVAGATYGRVRMARLSRCPRARPGRAGAALRAVTHIPRPDRNAYTDAVASPLRPRATLRAAADRSGVRGRCAPRRPRCGHPLRASLRYAPGPRLAARPSPRCRATSSAPAPRHSGRCAPCASRCSLRLRIAASSPTR